VLIHEYSLIAHHMTTVISGWWVVVGCVANKFSPWKKVGGYTAWLIFSVWYYRECLAVMPLLWVVVMST